MEVAAVLGYDHSLRGPERLESAQCSRRGNDPLAKRQRLSRLEIASAARQYRQHHAMTCILDSPQINIADLWKEADARGIRRQEPLIFWMAQYPIGNASADCDRLQGRRKKYSALGNTVTKALDIWNIRTANCKHKSIISERGAHDFPVRRSRRGTIDSIRSDDNGTRC